jgi:hypothetical protein
MGIAYRCDVSNRLSISVWQGEITADEGKLHLAALAADPEWAAGRSIVIDLTRVAATPTPADDVAQSAEAFLQILAGQARQAKWAIVADQTFERARAFGERVERAVPHLIVFNNLETACAWLGVDPTEVRTIADDLRREIRAREAPV